MWCLTLATNAIITWTTEYYGLGIAALRRDSRYNDEEVVAHMWPTHHENINFYGTHSVDGAVELSKLDRNGHRPLRARSLAPALDSEDDPGSQQSGRSTAGPIPCPPTVPPPRRPCRLPPCT